MSIPLPETRSLWRAFFILNTDEAVTILRSYNILPKALRHAGLLLAFQDAYGFRRVASSIMRRLVYQYERLRYLAVSLTPGYEPVFDVQIMRPRDVQTLSRMLSFDNVTKQWGYYAKSSRCWHFNYQAVKNCMIHEGHTWVTPEKIRDAIALRRERG